MDRMILCYEKVGESCWSCADIVQNNDLFILDKISMGASLKGIFLKTPPPFSHIPCMTSL